MSVRMTVLASGSRGNSTVLSSSKTSILVDAGLSCRETLKRMTIAGEDPLALKGIVITHEHSDHVSGLNVLARKLRIPVYMTRATHDAWKKWTRSPGPKRKCETENGSRARIEQLDLFQSCSSISTCDLDVMPL